MDAQTSSNRPFHEQFTEWWKSDKNIWKTHEKFAGRLKIGRSTVGDYLSGKSIPKGEIAKRIYEVTGLASLKPASSLIDFVASNESSIEKSKITESEVTQKGAAVFNGASKQNSNKLFGHPEKYLDHRSDISKALRDNIHMDIRLSALENDVINTSDFQRLDRIKQLGTAYLFRRGAKHTRFEHALGTLSVTQRIIDSINSHKPNSIPFREQVVARMTALLHDIGHIPFGHTLEDEAKVIKDKHDSGARLERFLNPQSEIGGALQDELRNRVISILEATGKSGEDKEKAISKLESPYIADIVGNTICADMLDYTKRDLRNCGLVADYDPQLFDYFEIDHNGERRAFLNAWREEEGGFTPEVISEVINLLRLRYWLAERVYFHPKKMITSAMISKAVYASGLKSEELWAKGDDELLHLLADEEKTQAKAAVQLAQALLNRDLYRPVYWLLPAEEKEDLPRYQVVKQLADKYHESPSERRDAEKEIANKAKVDPSDVVIYCPKLTMEMKSAEVRVALPNNQIKKLMDVKSQGIQQEVQRIMEQHRDLWRLYVFVAPKVYSDRNKVERINGACAEVFQLSNDNPEWTNRRPSEESSLKWWIEDFCHGKGATVPQMRQLQESVTKLDWQADINTQLERKWKDQFGQPPLLK
ncbi:MAG: HD domain-containing protein [Chloroflexi bacterium]|nr:HD domain-containing protein [Chloroflexota bacterium]